METIGGKLDILSLDDMFSPPVHRVASAVLDRSLFTKTLRLAAASVVDKRQIVKCRTLLEKSKDLLRVERVQSVQDVHGPGNTLLKGLLLRPEIKAEDPTTWSSVLRDAVDRKELGLTHFDLKLNYNHWTYLEIMKAILPEDAQDEIPVGFSIVGHVAHLNLRDQYEPYKKLIAQVLVDKNPTIKTVINKIDNVGTSSEFRTFEYEVLAGEDDLNVEIKEAECVFRFDYSKVYWNSRLNTEHKRLVSMFDNGEVVCDVMAGVGPFAVPAGKKGVFVWANDLNPESYSGMKDAISRNKVGDYVRPFCEDGHKFIHHAADELLSLTAKGANTISIPKKRSRNAAPSDPIPPPTVLTIPQTISHFVMNLPATAIEFLPAFNGLYYKQEAIFEPRTSTKLPMIHVHCFSTKSEDNVKEHIEICERISKNLDYEIKPGDDELTIYDVRDVAPLKRMFCASFRLPAEVAFRERRDSAVMSS